ncbi:prolipoprotein diacylglyceryl transferase [Streptoalloteichus hindustanus]|uniref:prolipoprotein diacylglyceryl transferase n=1 Tax=Streptoalloteichus hindustanus TaxID=2017 RepID=UPI000937F354|nr:prolipoprotein diacylglyceryl transferase [Streptoalloteichus hindustanus]
MTAFLATIPSPDRGVWHLGPIPIRAYALCIIAGIVVAIWWGEKRFVARGGQSGAITDIAVFAVPFGLVGGRLYHVATDWHKYFGPGKNPLDALKIWQGGLGIWGAVALGALGAWIACRRRGIPLTVVADAIAPGLVTAQAVGRLGNYFNQELYGGPTTLPWGLEIYTRIDEATGLEDPLGGVALNHTPEKIVHPTFLYELLWNLGVALLLVWADRKFRMGRGRVFALYVAGYTAGRCWIEMMRTDEATMVLGLRINVITSIVVFLAAVAYLLLVRGSREELPPVAAEGDTAAIDGASAETTPAATTPATTTPGGTAGAGADGTAKDKPGEPASGPTPDAGQPAEKAVEKTVEGGAEPRPETRTNGPAS